jgi:hypothetical protein
MPIVTPTGDPAARDASRSFGRLCAPREERQPDQADDAGSGGGQPTICPGQARRAEQRRRQEQGRGKRSSAEQQVLCRIPSRVRPDTVGERLRRADRGDWEIRDRERDEALLRSQAGFICIGVAP